MKKYRTEFKLEVVQSFLAGEGGAKLLARRWSAPEERIRTWVSHYHLYGIDGLRPKRSRYSAQFKLQLRGPPGAYWLQGAGSVVRAAHEIRDLRSQALLRTHTRVDRPGTVALPMNERVFNPSRESRFILAQASAIGPQAAQLCQMLFAIEGRVGQRKLWGIFNLTTRIRQLTA